MRARRLILVFFLFFCATAFAKDPVISEAEDLFKQGSYKEAADVLAPLVQGGQVSPDVLILYGKCLEGMTEGINTDAEKKCYRSAGAPHTPKCMYNYAEQMNAKYGAGSFEYVHDIITIKYTGAHFEQAAILAPKKGSKKGDTLAEAAYYDLTKNLIGQPSAVLPRIQEFLEKYPKGEWNQKGMLLWARINEDIWWIHRNWSWLIYDWQMSPEEAVVRAEPYRQEAIKAYKKIKKGHLGTLAKEELQRLLKNESDGKIYGIINESDAGGVGTRPLEKQQE